jgi:hypothetical protein
MHRFAETLVSKERIERNVAATALAKQELSQAAFMAGKMFPGEIH